MNANEVIATLAEERLGRPVHPERPRQRRPVVQRRVPSSIHVAAVTEISKRLTPALEHLSTALETKVDRVRARS